MTWCRQATRHNLKQCPKCLKMPAANRLPHRLWERSINNLNMTTNVLQYHLLYSNCSSTILLAFIRWLWRQKQVSLSGISNCTSQLTVGCNYLSLPEIPAYGAKVLLCGKSAMGRGVKVKPIHYMSGVWASLNQCRPFRFGIVPVLLSYQTPVSYWLSCSYFAGSTY